MVMEEISSFVVTTSSRGFIVKSIVTRGLLLLTDIYAKTSKTATVRSWNAASNPL